MPPHTAETLKAGLLDLGTPDIWSHLILHLRGTAYACEDIQQLDPVPQHKDQKHLQTLSHVPKLEKTTCG